MTTWTCPSSLWVIALSLATEGAHKTMWKSFGNMALIEPRFSLSCLQSAFHPAFHKHTVLSPLFVSGGAQIECLSYPLGGVSLGALLPQLSPGSCFLVLAVPRGLWDLASYPPGIEPMPSAVKTQSPNHWTAREFPQRLVSHPLVEGGGAFWALDHHSSLLRPQLPARLELGPVGLRAESRQPGSLCFLVLLDNFSSDPEPTCPLSCGLDPHLQGRLGVTFAHEHGLWRVESSPLW